MHRGNDNDFCHDGSGGSIVTRALVGMVGELSIVKVLWVESEQYLIMI